MTGRLNLARDRWVLGLEVRPHIMGIINVTPDSFSDGGDFLAYETAVAQGLTLVNDGADLLDIGGESTRPGAPQVSEAEELARVIPVIKALAAQVSVPISIDTYKALVARKALEAGASIINDISAGRFDPEMFQVAANFGVPIILMHMKGRPQNMQINPVYDDVVAEVKSFLSEAASGAEAAGIAPEKVIIDPGIGFGKTFDHNLILINRLNELAELGRPLMVGPSRKAFLGKILDGAPPKDRDLATATVAALCAYQGANILRVHDVKSTKIALTVTAAVLREHV